MTVAITLEDTRGYSSEKSLIKGLRRFGFVDEERSDMAFYDGHKVDYIVCRKPDGSWTAVFMLSQTMNRENIGGYVGFYSGKQFMTV